MVVAFVDDGVELAAGRSLASSNELEVSMLESASGGLGPFSASQVWMYLGERGFSFCFVFTR